MPLDHLAFDIETIPGKPVELYSEGARAIIDRKIARAAEYDPEMSFEKFASLNADFGRIICISVGYVRNGRINLKSLCGDDERAILEEFNNIIAKVKGIFIHFNGLNFDAPFIMRRMRHHGISLANPDFANLRRYQESPHLDLMQSYYNWDARAMMPLGLLAEIHRLPSPKGDLNGSQVHAAYLREELSRISRYCEFDVATTLNLWRKAWLFEEALDCELYHEEREVEEAV
jgi:3'-5' exonuclease